MILFIVYDEIFDCVLNMIYSVLYLENDDSPLFVSFAAAYTLCVWTYDEMAADEAITNEKEEE